MTEKGKLNCNSSETQDFVIGGFKVVGVISEAGTHGLVVSCTDAANKPYAMKIERKYQAMKNDNVALHEILDSCLNKGEDNLYIPRLATSFREQGTEISVMELLGPDLFTLLHTRKSNSFSSKTTMQIALSLITAYEQIHQSGWLHLTAKPINFCIGGTAETRHKVYAIDFGRAQKYIVQNEFGHKVHRSEGDIGATPSCIHWRFASIWGEAQQTPSRRDDMMSLALMLMYLECNAVPWTEMGLTKFEWLEHAKTCKLTLWESLIVSASLMAFDEQPFYETWRQLIYAWAAKKEIQLDGQFDWDDEIKQDENGRIVLRSD
jgi:serine/threonine protein kinase